MKTFKYLAMSFMASCFFFAASAQDDDMNQKAESGDISVGFNYDLSPNFAIGGLLGGGGGNAPNTGNQWRNDAFGNAQIFGRYYLSSDLAIRVGLGINSNSTNTLTKDSTTMWSESVTDKDNNTVSASPDTDSALYSETEVNSSQFNFSIAPGVEKHLSTNSNIDPYVGAQIPIAILGGTSVDSTVSRTGAQGGEEVTYDYDGTTERPGGFGWGVQGIIGFNWFVGDKVSIGMEYKLGFMQSIQGGEVTGSATEDIEGTGSDKLDGVESSSWSHQNEVTNSDFQTMSRGGINVAIFF